MFLSSRSTSRSMSRWYAKGPITTSPVHLLERLSTSGSGGATMGSVRMRSRRNVLLLLKRQPYAKCDKHDTCESLQDSTDTVTYTASPSPTDHKTVQVEPTEQDRLIGEHH